MTSTLVLLRHGQSQWNAENLFTGWWDADLTELGEQQAVAAGELMAEAGVELDVVHTSLQTRAIRTADLALEELGALWVPVRRHWRLNERHYGDLTGRNKAETAERYGAEQVKVWRRSYDVPPPDRSPTDNPHNPNDDRRYAHVPPDGPPEDRVPGGRGGPDAALLVRRRSSPIWRRTGRCSSPPTATACARW